MISPNLVLEILDELNNPRYASRTHGRRACVNAGCKGPLCRKFTRDRMRELYREQNPNPSRKRGPADPEVDQFLETVIRAHASSKSLARAS